MKLNSFIFKGLWAIFPCTFLLAQQNTSSPSLYSLEELLNTPLNTASKYEQTISEAPASVSIITSDEIEQFGYQTLGDVLNAVRGFYTRDDRNYIYTGVRGLSRPGDYDNRILILIDGHIRNDNVYGAAVAGYDLTMDMDIVERIEIVRGPGSVQYGSNAMLAVINIVTKKSKQINGIQAKVRRGTYSDYHTNLAAGKEITDDFSFLLSFNWGEADGPRKLYYSEYDDPATNNGISEGLDWNEYYGGIASLTYKNLSISGGVSSFEKGIPTGAWEMTFNDPAAKSIDGRWWVDVRLKKQFSHKTVLELNSYYDEFQFDGYYPYDDGMWYDAHSGRWLSNEVKLKLDLSSRHRLVAGLEYKRLFEADYRTWDEDTTYFNHDFPSNVSSFYLQDEFQFSPALSIVAGIRGDFYSDQDNALTPRGAMIYNPRRSTTLKLLYGEAYRIPSVYEKHYADSDLVKGNPSLQPENLRTIELVWEQRIGTVLMSTVSLYQTNMNRLIEQTMDEEDELYQFQNLGKVESNGVECELQFRPKSGMSAYLNYSLQQAKDLKTKQVLNNSPRHLAKGGFHFSLLNMITLAAECRFESSRFTVYRTQTDPYFHTNINITTKPFLKYFKFSFLLNNVFDVAYSYPGGFEHLQPALLQNGRTYLASLRFNQ